MELRPQALPVQGLRRHRLRREVQSGKRLCAGSLELHGETLAEERLQVAEHLVVSGPVRQVDVEVAHGLATGAQAQVAARYAPRTGGRPPAHRKNQISPVDVQLSGQHEFILTIP